jgi:hypothetical protein
VTVTPQALAPELAQSINPPLPFEPVIGTLIPPSTSSSGSSTSATGAPAGPTAQNTPSLARGQSAKSNSSNSVRVSHAHPHPHPSHHATPHGPGITPPVVPIIPDNVAPPLLVAAAAAGRQNNAPAAVAAGVAAGLPAQDAKAGPTAIPIGGPTQLESPNTANLGTYDTGAVGTTMKVITVIQAQRIWSRGHKSHHHGSRRRFR